MKNEEILESVKFWEEMAKKWSSDSQWRMTAPDYGEIVAEIVASRLRFYREDVAAPITNK